MCIDHADVPQVESSLEKNFHFSVRNALTKTDKSVTYPFLSKLFSVFDFSVRNVLTKTDKSVTYPFLSKRFSVFLVANVLTKPDKSFLAAFLEGSKEMIHISINLRAQGFQ